MVWISMHWRLLLGLKGWFCVEGLSTQSTRGQQSVDYSVDRYGPRFPVGSTQRVMTATNIEKPAKFLDAAAALRQTDTSSTDAVVWRASLESRFSGTPSQSSEPEEKIQEARETRRHLRHKGLA